MLAETSPPSVFLQHKYAIEGEIEGAEKRTESHDELR